MIDTIFARRSIRQYTDEPVTEAQVSTLLQAAMAAPSASNRQPWHFVAIQNRDTLKALAEGHPYGRMLAGAAVGFAVCADPAISPRHWIEDCSAATQNLLLAATALGLGGVWIAVWPDPTLSASVRAILEIPQTVETLCLVSVGHPAEHKPPRTQFNPQCVHRDRW